MKRSRLRFGVTAALLGGMFLASVSWGSLGVLAAQEDNASASADAASAGGVETALFSASAMEVSTGDLVTFEASASAGDSLVVLYEWDFDGDGAIDAVAAGAVVEHAYARSGIFSVRLTTVNEEGQVDTASTPVLITVVNRTPVAAMSVAEGMQRAMIPVQFSAEGSSDVDGSIVAWQWEYGDGATGEGESPLHTYEAAGSYVVRLTVTDDNGATASVVSAPLAIEDAPPSAGFSVEEARLGNLLARFVDTTTVADPADIVYVAWDFGDGVYRAGGPSSTGVYVHAYETSGSYVVTLYVIDKYGAMSIVSQSVWIRD
jgi:PKD repeat protein